MLLANQIRELRKLRKTPDPALNTAVNWVTKPSYK
jgi:hypothetical protein